MRRATPFLAVLLATGCLDAPGSGAGPGDASPGGDGGEQSDAGPGAADAEPCTGVQFGFAYVSEVHAPLEGGSLDDVGLVQALTTGVDLSEMTDEGPDGPSVNLYFSEVSFDVVPVGEAVGILGGEAEELIIGSLVDGDAWSNPTQPGFGIEALASPTGGETSLEVQVEVRINGASVFLPISVKWRSDAVAIGGDVAAYAVSECGVLAE